MVARGGTAGYERYEETFSGDHYQESIEILPSLEHVFLIGGSAQVWGRTGSYRLHTLKVLNYPGTKAELIS